jgi:hypothetical protein
MKLIVMQFSSAPCSQTPSVYVYLLRLQILLGMLIVRREMVCAYILHDLYMSSEEQLCLDGIRYNIW